MGGGDPIKGGGRKGGKLKQRRFERRTSPGRGIFAFSGSGFAHIFGQIHYLRLNTKQYKFVSVKTY